MTLYKEGARPQQFILDEANGQRSRDNITIAPSQDFAAGAILAKAGNAYAVWAGGAGALAIANYGAKTDATGDPVRISAITRDAEVNRWGMSWPDGTVDADVDAAAVELAKQGIILRGVSWDQMGGEPASPAALREGRQSSPQAGGGEYQTATGDQSGVKP